MTGTALSLRGITKRYGTGEGALEVLHGVDLDVDDGELLAVVGPSGSGKSTLLNIMGTLDRPSSGTVRFGDSGDVTTLGDAALSRIRGTHLGFVFQQFFLLDGRSAVENVADGLLYQGVPSSERRRRAAAALDKVGLGHRLGHRPAQLSGGECQRVAIARALVHDPRVVLADEPTGNLDSASGAAVMELFRTLNEAGATIVIITHDAEIAASLPRLVAIRDGRIEADDRELAA